jgi:NADPH-dependent F420 reductase
MKIAVVGGTGKEGSGLAVRWASAGHQVTIGSRDAARALERAAELSRDGSCPIQGGENLEVARAAEIVVLSVPYDAHRATLERVAPGLQGKILVDLTVPLRPPAVRKVHLPPGQAAALEGQAFLGAGVRVVAALHHVSSVQLGDPAHPIDCDVLVASDDPEARNLVIGLCRDLGLRGIDAGPLPNAIALEALTPVILHINRRYGVKATGIRFTGLPS